jgi:hypothetical protein
MECDWDPDDTDSKQDYNRDWQVVAGVEGTTEWNGSGVI